MSPASTGRTGDGHQGRGVPERPGQSSGNRSGRDVPRQRPPQDRHGSQAEWDDYATPPRPQRGARPQSGRDTLGGHGDPWEQRPSNDPYSPDAPTDGRDARYDTGSHVIPDSPGVAGRGRRRKSGGSPSDTGEFSRHDFGNGDTGQFPGADRRSGDTGQVPRQDYANGDTGQFARTDRLGDTGQFPRTDRSRGNGRAGDTGEFTRLGRKPGETGEFPRTGARRPGDSGEFPRTGARRPGDTGEFPRGGTRRPGDTGESPRQGRLTDTGQFQRQERGTGSTGEMPWQREASSLTDDRATARRGRTDDGMTGRRDRADDDSWPASSMRRTSAGTLEADDDAWSDDEEPQGWRARRRARKQRKLARLTYAQVRLRRNIKLGIACGMLGVLFWLTVSIGQALTAPGHEDLQSRLAGWARQNGLGFAVSWMENQKYAMNPPKSGGQLSQADLNSLTQTPSNEPTLGKDEHVLPPMKLFLPNPAPDEGVWEPAVVVNGIPVIQTAKLRADAVHTSYLSAVAYIDQKHASFVLHPGVQQPGDPAAYSSTALLAGSQLKNLIATWNGGFMLKPNDAHGGFYLNGKTYGTLVAGQASEIFKKDGTIDVGAWGQPGFTMSDQVVGVRQNLPLLVDNGQVDPSVDSTDKKLWGVTVKNAYFVWRSGIGITANGNIVYAMGPTLSVRTLAELLQRAGAVRGMELDINQEWVSFMTYDGSKDPTNPTSTKLLDFARTARRYFSTEDRDFVAVYARP